MVVLTLRSIGLLALACTVCCLTGCGGNQPYGTVRVSGRVTYDDGSTIPAHRIAITFIPSTSALDAKTHPRAGNATTNADGTFDVVTTYAHGDGLIAGKHKVIVRSSNAEYAFTDDVPAAYTVAETTPLEIDTADAPLEIRIEKPAKLQSK